MLPQEKNRLRKFPAAPEHSQKLQNKSGSESTTQKSIQPEKNQTRDKKIRISSFFLVKRNLLLKIVQTSFKYI